MSFASMTKEQRQEAKLLGEERFAKRIDEFKKTAHGYYAKFIDNIPQRYKKNWLDCWEGTASKRKAIAAKCYECVGYEDTQNNVGGCTARACPLWRYRPLQKK